MSNLPLLIFISNICVRNKRNVQQFIHSKHIRLLIVLGTCLHGGGGLQVGEVTRLSIQSVILVDHVYITVGGVTCQGELTPLSGVKFSHVNVSRWGNPPSRGRIRDTKFAQNSVFSGSYASLLKITIESQSTEACSKSSK